MLAGGPIALFRWTTVLDISGATSHARDLQPHRPWRRCTPSQDLVMTVSRDAPTQTGTAAQGAVTGTAPASALRGASMIEAVLLAVWAAPCLLITVGLFYRSTMLLQRNYNEGWNAFHAASWLHGGPLYYPASALVTNNYPPLSFIAVGWLMHLIPDAVFAGRALADAALIGMAALIVLILRATARDGAASHDNLAAVAGGVTFLSYMAINAEGYVGVDDPQFLSLAVLLLGLYVKVRLGPRPAADILSAVVMTISLFVKHNNIALPLTMGVWLLIFDRMAGLRFIVTGVVAGLCGLLAARFAFGPAFITSLLAPRVYSLTLAARQALDWLGPLKPLVVLAAIPVVLFPRDRTALFFGGYLAAALLIGCMVAAGSGTGPNAMYEVVIAASLAIGYLLARLGRPGLMRYARLRACVIVAAAFATVLTPDLYTAKDVLTLPSWLTVQRQREATTRLAVQFIASQPGPALCSTPTYCYWAGKPFEIDPFNFGQAVLTQRKSVTELTDRIDAGYYGTIEFFDAWDDAALPASRQVDIRAALMAAIARSYRQVPVTDVPSSFWVRKTPGTGG
jgi:hypothetical protein